MSRISKAITVSGRVQNVWYRKHTKLRADELGLNGTVQNLDNGNVLILVTGEEPKVAELEQWCWTGSPQSDVKAVESSEIQTASYQDFRIME